VLSNHCPKRHSRGNQIEPKYCFSHSGRTHIKVESARSQRSLQRFVLSNFQPTTRLKFLNAQSAPPGKKTHFLMISTRGVTKADLSPHEITHRVVANVNHAMRIHSLINATAALACKSIMQCAERVRRRCQFGDMVVRVGQTTRR
jgi:hypothetical protein